MWYLLTVLIALLVLRRSTDGGSRRITNGLILLTLLLALGSTPLVGILLESSLRVDRTSVSGSTPEFIIVLAGGRTALSSPEEYVLNTGGAQRIRHAVTEWRSNPNARLILSGATGLGEELAGRHLTLAELMARAAASYGVPDSVLILEPRSTNTREYPVEALRLPGVTPGTHMAVVTSGWHTRRARREFCRYFERIDLYPVPPLERIISLSDLMPHADTLAENTRFLREWFAIVWYAIRGIGVEAVGDC